DSNRLIAVAEYGGALRMIQNFTDDSIRLKQVVTQVKFSATAPNDTTNRQFRQFSVRGILGALTSVAKGLNNVPGRKTIVFLSAGFKLDAELLNDLTATINACNHANVAVYPIDVRGLVVGKSVTGQLFGLPGFSQTALLNAMLQMPL